MPDINQAAEPAKGGESAKELPTRELLRKWIDRDARAAHALLQYICDDPELLDRIADHIFSRTIDKFKDEQLLNQKEGGENGSR